MARNEEYITPKGIAVEETALVLPRAQQFAALLSSGALDYATLGECRVSDDGSHEETIVFDVDVERPQVRKYDIRSHERIAATFYEDDSIAPETVALRADFPRVPHLNLRRQEVPRSLCLEERLWDEVKLDWNPARHVQLIRSWLSRTARGSLHQPDQPLEPMLFGSGYHIVVPSKLLDPEAATQAHHLHVVLKGGQEGQVLLAKDAADATAKQGGLPFAAAFVSCPSQVHGVIWHQPRSLSDLHKMLADTHLDLRTTLVDKLWALKNKDNEVLDLRLIVLVAFPKRRRPQAPVETVEFKTFLTLSTVREVGESLGCWVVHDGQKLFRYRTRHPMTTAW